MKVETALIIILAIDLFLFMGQLASAEINTEFGFTVENPSFYSLENSTIGAYDSGGYVIDETQILDELPASEGGSIVSEVTSIFTDTFKSIKNWFLNTTGLKYLTGIVNAVPHFLGGIGLPAGFIFAISAFWHALTVFLIIAFIRG